MPPSSKDDNRPRMLWKASLTAKIGALLLLAFFVALSSATVTSLFLSMTRHDLEIVDVLGRQRMLSMTITSLSHNVAEGRDEDRPELARTTESFREVLVVLSGNDGSDELLEPKARTALSPSIPTEVRLIARDTMEIWARTEPALAILLDPDAGAVELFDAREVIIEEGPRLARASDEMVQAYRRRAARLQENLRIAEVIVVLVSFLLLLGGVILARRRIVGPLQRLTSGVERIRSGEFGHRVAIVQGDELEILARAFNDTAEELEALVEALDEARDFAETLIEHMPVGIAVHRAGEMVFSNPELRRLLKERTSETLCFVDAFEVEDQPLARDILLPSHLDTTLARRAELRLAGPRETAPIVEILALAVDFRGDPSTLLLVRDISEQRRLMARMMEMDRVISIGTLVAGVGHEINNPLTYVMGNLSFALDQLADLEEAGSEDLALIQRALEDAHDGASRIRDIVLQLRTFSRTDTSPRRPTKVEDALESAINMAQGEIRHRATLVRDYEEVPPVEANESQLAQVFLNLLVNAAQAIPDGQAEDNEIRVAIGLVNGKVCVRISDTGAGMPAEVRARIFDPFFTTKEVGEGTGLGLSISQRIISDHGGLLSVDSTEGEGTTFEIFLPALP